MKWLETPHDEGERLLREGLDQAGRRTGDQITHRRVWAKLSEALAMPEPRFSGRLALASAALVLLLAGAVVGFPRLAEYFAARNSSVATGAKVTTPPATVHPAPIANSAASARPTAAAHPGRTVLPFTKPKAAAAEQAALLETERVPGHVVRTRTGEKARRKG